MREKFFSYIADIDRKHIYITFFLVIAVFILFRLDIPSAPSLNSKKFYAAVESVPAGGVILVSLEYDFAAEPELKPMLVSMLVHAFRNNLKIIFVSLAPESSDMANNGMTAAFRDSRLYGRKIVYGRDYINLGFIAGGGLAIRAMAADMNMAYKKDAFGAELDKFPLMKDIKSLDDIDLIADFSSISINGMPGPIAFAAYAANQKQIVAGVTASFAPEHYPFLDSGQIKGMLAGIRGAADYESLTGTKGDISSASGWMTAQTMGHILFFLLIIAGNIGFIAMRSRK